MNKYDKFYDDLHASISELKRYQIKMRDCISKIDATYLDIKYAYEEFEEKRRDMLKKYDYFKKSIKGYK